VPWLGRWLSPDPSGLIAGFNRFCYVDSNPVKLEDKNGRWPELVDDLKSKVKRAAQSIAADPVGALAGAAMAVIDNTTMGGGTAVNDLIHGKGETARGIGSRPAAAEAYTIVSVAQPLAEVGIGGTILIGGGGGGAAATAGSGGVAAPVAAPVAGLSVLAGGVLVAHGGIALATTIPRVQAVRAHMSSTDSGSSSASPSTPSKPAKIESDATPAPQKPSPPSDKPPTGSQGQNFRNIPATKQREAAEAAAKRQEFEKRGGKVKPFGPKETLHEHHLFPQEKELQAHWDSLGINNQDPKFKVFLDAEKHLQEVHKGEAGGLWNQTWKDFFKKNPNASPDDAYKQLDVMRKSFGI
jgi:hypothetical protein